MIGVSSKEGMEASGYDISEGELETYISEKIKQKWFLPMHPMHVQPYNFLACAPIFLQILEEKYGSPQGAWS